MSDSTLADGVLAIVKAATEPLIDEIKSLRGDVAALKTGTRPSDDVIAAPPKSEAQVIYGAIRAMTDPLHARIAAIEKALGIPPP